MHSSNFDKSRQAESFCDSKAYIRQTVSNHRRLQRTIHCSLPSFLGPLPLSLPNTEAAVGRSTDHVLVVQRLKRDVLYRILMSFKIGDEDLLLNVKSLD